MATRRRNNQVKRKICFYRIDAGLDESGRPLPFDPRPYLTTIQKLPFRRIGGRYSREEGGYIACWIDRCTPPYRLKYGKITWDEPPQVEHNGALSHLPLGDNDGLVSPIHLVLYSAPPYWFVGCEYKFAGPRIARLASYLSEKTNCPNLNIMPLVGQSAMNRLFSFRDLRSFTFRVHPSYVDYLPKPPHGSQVEQFLDSAQRLGQSDVVEVTLRCERKTGRKLPIILIEYVAELMKSPFLRRGVMEGKLRGLSAETGHVEVLEMLNAQLMSIVSIPRSSARKSPASEDVYTAIEQAIERKLPELTVAAGMTASKGGTNESRNSVA